MKQLMSKAKRWARYLKRYQILVKSSVSDLRRYARHSLGNANRDDEVVTGQLLKSIHSLEKGLIMPGESRVFGAKKVALIKDLLSHLSRTPANEWLWAYADRVLGSVETHNNGLRSGEPLSQRLEGTISISKEMMLAALPPSPENFFFYRKSVREYSPEPVAPEILARAVALAQRAPSVCNRQSGRVRFYSKDTEKQAILNLQSGNSGFGHLAPVVAIISTDIRSFMQSEERNQCFIDGGLFAMSLGMALHSLGLGACMLNWSVNPARDCRLRKQASIPDNEVIIMMMSLGHLRPQYRSAESYRRPVHEVWMNQETTK